MKVNGWAMMLIKRACPNCGGDISEERLRSGLPCARCLPLVSVNVSSVRDLKGHRKLRRGALDKLFLLEDEVVEFERFFSEATGARGLWSIQRAWARRMLAGESFALIAPTGVGKTTLLITYAVYRASRGDKVLYIVPTRELMNQVVRRLRIVAEKAPGVSVISTQDLKKSGIECGKRCVLVSTHAFLFRNKETLAGKRFDVVLVDDFDALLKSSGLLNLILGTLGIEEEVIELATEVVKLKQEAAFYKYMGNDEKYSEVVNRLYEVEEELATKLGYRDIGQLLIASATGRGSSLRIKVLRELLGFEVGSIIDYLRKTVNTYLRFESYDQLATLLKKLHPGTLVFVSSDLGREEARKIASFLSASGIPSKVAESRKALDLLRSGEVNVLVGTATYYGILTRGIDEPERVYNVVFVGVPKFTMPLESFMNNPRRIVSVSSQLAREGRVSADWMGLLRRVARLSPGKLKVIEAFMRGIIEELHPPLSEIASELIKLRDEVVEVIAGIVEEKGKFVGNGFIVVKRKGTYTVMMPDVMTFIQASGRSSRLLKGRMTLGLVILFYDDEDLLNMLINKVRRYISNFEMVPFNEIDLRKVIREQRMSRRAGRGGKDVEHIKAALMVVESPTKAKTIARFFGRPGRRYIGSYTVYETVIPIGDTIYVTTIAPTMGHILDLSIGEGLHGIIYDRGSPIPVYTTIKRCRDCGYQFTDETRTCPRCGSINVRDSRTVIEALRKLAQEADLVILATDPDEEGEKIAYDVYLLLRPYTNRFVRIEFHEVTKQGIDKALANPREIDMRRVDAQIVRRADDRIVGFEISNILKEHFGKHWLGGGRVQTPVLAWVTENYKKYLEARGYWVIAKLSNGIVARFFIKEKEEAKKLAERAKEGVLLKVVSVEEKVVNPPPPYTTDSLLADAMRYLRLPPNKVMRLAQELFEMGYITYHRTDSTHVSAAGMGIAKEYLRQALGEEYIHLRSWGGEGTHECIRPTKAVPSLDLMDDIYASGLSYEHKRLYSMIFNRFIASQMRPAKVRYAKITLTVGAHRLEMEVPTEIIEHGFTKMLKLRTYEVTEGVVGAEEVKVVRGSLERLLTASDVVRMMKERRIGRPSTYAKAIENNVRHGYIIISKYRTYLIPTKLGMNIIEFVKSTVPELASEDATRALELLTDIVRAGRMSREKALTYLLMDAARLRFSVEVAKAVHGEEERSF